MNEMRVTEFLSAFFSNEEKIILRTIPDQKNWKERGWFIPITLTELKDSEDTQTHLIEENKTKDVCFYAHSGAVHNNEITRYNAFVIELSRVSSTAHHNILNDAPIPPNIRVENKNSICAFWLIEGDCSQTEWIDVQNRLIAYFKDGEEYRDPARLFRIPFFNQVFCNGKSCAPKKVEVVEFDPSRRFTVEEMKNVFLPPESYAKSIMKAAAVEQLTSSLNSYKSFESTDRVSARETEAVEKINSLNSLNSSQDDKKGVSEFSYETSEITSAQERKCFYGLAGEIVRIIEPHSEADPLALLLNTLIMFGNVIGRTAFFEADGAQHFTNLYGVLVGGTSAGKGTSSTQIKRLFALIDEDWSRNQIQRGLSSGEGVIAAVKESDISNDKRLLVIEGEFSAVLSMTKREGNTLSQIIRSFWDEGIGQTMTKNDPISVNNAHISIIGHITPDELRARLNQTEIANGFVNRFLWLQVKRSKLLPEGGNLSGEELKALAAQILESIRFAQTIEKMERDEEARLFWREKYPTVVKERAGAFGNATMRARSQIARISLIYALMDKSNIVRLQHLEAALDFWSYCENSARQIFGESTGDKLADDILQFLRNAENGLSRSEITKLTGNNFNAKRISDALRILADNNLASCRTTNKSDSKKPVEVWFANEFNEFNEFNVSKEPVRD